VKANTDQTVAAVRDYWDSHTLGLQYVTDHSLAPGTRAFFDAHPPVDEPLQVSMDHGAHRPRGAVCSRANICSKSAAAWATTALEFLKRGVRVTAIDLTPSAVHMRSALRCRGCHGRRRAGRQCPGAPVPDETFDAVWSNGVLHATGDTPLAIAEVRRVLKPGGRAVISHFYRRPSWMWVVHRLGREPIEAHEEDPPVNEFYTEEQILAMFERIQRRRYCPGASSRAAGRQARHQGRTLPSGVHAAVQPAAGDRSHDTGHTSSP
jgi:SAM-dependent methyltransferase